MRATREGNVRGALTVRTCATGDLGFDPLGLKPDDPKEFYELATKEVGYAATKGAEARAAHALVPPPVRRASSTTGALPCSLLVRKLLCYSKRLSQAQQRPPPRISPCHSAGFLAQVTARRPEWPFGRGTLTLPPLPCAGDGRRQANPRAPPVMRAMTIAMD